MIHNYVEDDMLAKAVTDSEVCKILAYPNLKFSNSQLHSLYSRGHKTAVLASSKLNSKFLSTIDLSKEWYNYAPLYSNKFLSRTQLYQLIARFETERSEDPELLLRVYLFSNLSFEEALSKVDKLHLKDSIYNLANILVEARQEDIVAHLSEEEREAPEHERRKSAYIWAKTYFQDTQHN